MLRRSIAVETAPVGLDRIVAIVEKRRRLFRPDRPVSQQSTHDLPFDNPPLHREAVGREEIHHDVVVVSGVERDIAAAGFRHGPHHLQSLIAIEGCDLDRDDVLDLCELPPEAVGKRASSYGGLQVESDDRHDLRHGPAVFQQARVIGVFHCRQAEEAGVIARRPDLRRLSDGLGRSPADARDPHHRRGFRHLEAIHLLRSKFQYRSEQADFRGAYRELRGMHADGKSAGSGSEVVPCQRPLPALVQSALRRQGERMCGNHQPSGQSLPSTPTVVY